jgi:hypothetical protein
MSQCCNKRQPPKAVSLVFKREQLLYDIGTYAFVEGDIMVVGDEHERHQVMDVTQSGNIDIATRILNLAHSEVVEMLYPYTKEPVTPDESFDDELDEPEEYMIDLRLPLTFSRTSVKYLRWLIHEYMVSRVLQEWMGLTNLANPQSKKNWEEKIESIKTKIKSAIMWRGRPLRIKQHPF